MYSGGSNVGLYSTSSTVYVCTNLVLVVVSVQAQEYVFQFTLPCSSSLAISDKVSIEAGGEIETNRWVNRMRIGRSSAGVNSAVCCQTFMEHRNLR